MTRRIHVCEQCIEDEALQDVVRENATSNRCDYCGRQDDEPIASELSAVIERIRYAIAQEYSEPISELPFDDEEGDYHGNYFLGSEVFDEIGFGVENTELWDDICEEFADEAFCSRDYFGPAPDEFFEAAWDRFKRVVQEQGRDAFRNSFEEGEYGDPARGVSASGVLPEIGRNIERVSPVITIPVGTRIWRVQTFDRGSSSIVPARYTSPPNHLATQPNRMSDAGMSMFYGAEDFETAKAEVTDPSRTNGKDATGVQFATCVPLTILDLSSIRRPRSFFVDLDRRGRHAIEFLEAFADEVSRPIIRDERQHIEYVPTQVFTEHVRVEMQAQDGTEFHGIKYRSSRTGRACYVLFAEQDDCLEGPTNRSRPQWLQFVDGSFRTEEC